MKIGFVSLGCPKNQIDTEIMLREVAAAGYERCDQIEGAGQFAVRGGILDLFAANAQNPVRIEYWGDEIDTLSYFDLDTQRRTEVVDEIKLSPAAEVVFNSYSLADSLENYLKTTKKLSEKRKARLESDIQLLKGEVDIVADRYLSAVYRNATIFDYVDDAVILVSDSAGVFDTLGGVFARSKEDAQLLCDDGFISAGFDKFTLDQTEFEEIINKAVFLENFARTKFSGNFKDVINFNFK